MLEEGVLPQGVQEQLLPGRGILQVRDVAAVLRVSRRRAAAQRIPAGRIQRGAVVLVLGGERNVVARRISQPGGEARTKRRIVRGLQRLRRERGGASARPFEIHHRGIVRQSRNVDTQLRRLSVAAREQPLRTERIRQFLAQGELPALAPVGGAEIRTEDGVASLIGELGRIQRAQGSAGPQRLAAQHRGAEAVFAQARRVERDDGAQRPGAKIVGRVVAKRDAVARIDAPEVRDAVRPRLPAHIGFLQGVDIPIAGDPVHPVQVQAVGEDGAPARCEGLVQAHIERQARPVQRRARALLPRRALGRFHVHAPVAAFLGRHGGLVGEQQRRRVVVGQCR